MSAIINPPAKTGLIGFPVEKSLLPALYNAAYDQFDLNWRYHLYPAASSRDFDRLFAELSVDESCAGLSVTLPYQRAAAEAVTSAGGMLVDTAQDVGALTLVSLVYHGTPLAQQSTSTETLPGKQAALVDKNEVSPPWVSLLGYNLDGAGLVASLRRRTDLHLVGARVVIYGTGATSASFCLALAAAGASEVTVVSRHSARARDFVANLSASFCKQQPDGTFRGLGDTDEVLLRSTLEEATLLIDATSTGTYPDDLALLSTNRISPQHTVLDVVYGQGQTQLLRAARAAGARAFDGLDMMVETAALGFSLWCEASRIQPVPNNAAVFDVMMKAARAELQRRELIAP
ncbi:MAG: hypothetical protein LBU07_06590 [Coriobacteriales bacterium]|jgi:shikimate dehydrogenase|nr:hypothetical protein [Coriobacteriales bacterium]